LQIVFAAALAGIVSSQLDYQPSSPSCQLNSSGQVCIFTYITAGEIMLYAMCLIIPLVWVGYKRRSPAPVIGVYFSMSFFSWFWQLVMCITIQIRGGQASDAGVPNDGARTSALAFAWLGCALTTLTTIVILLELFRQRRQAVPLDTTSPTSMKKPDGSILDSSANSSVDDAAMKSV
jgi:hypothetical protein